MATYYFMDAALLKCRGMLTPDNVIQRGAHQGHSDTPQLRYEGFEKVNGDTCTASTAYKSDDFLRFQKLFENGDLVPGTRFVLGFVDSLAGLDYLVWEQNNTIPGLQIQLTVVNQNFEPVEAESALIDFTNACVDCRWETQPVGCYQYDQTNPLTKSGKGEYFYLVAELVAVPEEWFGACGNCCDELPNMSARLHYDSLCLSPGTDVCAPQDVIDAYNAAIEAFEGENTIIKWSEIDCPKDPVLGM